MTHTHIPQRNQPEPNQKPIVLLGPKEDWKYFTDLIDGLRARGTIRTSDKGETLLDYVTHFAETPQQAIDHLKANIPTDIVKRRQWAANHKTYIDLPDALTDHIMRDEQTAKPKLNAPTIAFFGSATSKNPIHHEIGREAGRMCGHMGWNIIHGGGIAGVMGAISEGAMETGAHVHGITAATRYALYLSGEKHADEAVPKGQGRYTAGKDMIHRIELYAKNSEAMVALPGGVGTLEEAFLTIKLLEEQHEAVMYKDTAGNLVKKPFILVNQDGIWDGIIKYYNDRPHLKAAFEQNVTVVDTIPELNQKLNSYFKEHPPVSFAIDRLDETIHSHAREVVRRQKHPQLTLFQ
jgi:uncharacterized protein (TIGR00730 family)